MPLNFREIDVASRDESVAPRQAVARRLVYKPSSERASLSSVLEVPDRGRAGQSVCLSVCLTVCVPSDDHARVIAAAATCDGSTGRDAGCRAHGGRRQQGEIIRRSE